MISKKAIVNFGRLTYNKDDLLGKISQNKLDEMCTIIV